MLYFLLLVTVKRTKSEQINYSQSLYREGLKNHLRKLGRELQDGPKNASLLRIMHRVPTVMNNYNFHTHKRIVKNEDHFANDVYLVIFGTPYLIP